MALAAIPTVSVAAPPPPSSALAEHPFSLSKNADLDLRAFYNWRNEKPLWISEEGRVGSAALALSHLIATSDRDGINPERVYAPQLALALKHAERDQSSSVLNAAELALSRSFAAYVRELRQRSATAMLYEHQILEPRNPGPSEVLLDAARAPSLTEYVHTMGWMHPLYAPLRQALAPEKAVSLPHRNVIMANLERLRAIPAFPGRYVLVDAASAQLWMYEDGRAVDSMRVVVGKSTHQTPMMAGYIRQAIFNPYWNVPDELIQANIAPNVLRQGAAYLKKSGYEVLSDWSVSPSKIDPSSVDWRSVAGGKTELRVRQLPGPSNSMGAVKFEFPNKLGIYLHDTPAKDLMTKEARQLSSGCIRLEDASRLGRWLLNGTAPGPAGPAEQRVDLPKAVPIFVTYLTARIIDGRLALNDDPYRRDGVRALASSGEPNVAIQR